MESVDRRKRLSHFAAGAGMWGRRFRLSHTTASVSLLKWGRRFRLPTP
jgi:hypothetical protein